MSPRLALWIAVAVGMALRAYHYARVPAVWHDEAALIANVLALSYPDMFGPLLHAEAAPPLFLVLERAAVDAFGDGELALRLPPFLASCLTLFVVARVSTRLLSPWPAALSVLLVAVSDRLLWHACEAKPYSFDVLLAALAVDAVSAGAGRRLWPRAIPLAVAAPLALWVSFPACFVAGGVLIALLPDAWRHRHRAADVIGYGLVAAAVAGAFVALAAGPVAAQRVPAMESCWVRHFPDYSKPLAVPVWVVASVPEVFRYGLLPLGQLLLPVAGFGAVALWRTGDRGRAAVLAATVPVALAFVAALLHKYPFGGSRLEVFAVPGYAVLVAAGVAPALAWVGRFTRFGGWLVVPLLLLPVGQTLFRAAVPWPRAASDEAAAYILAHRGPDDRIVVNHWEYEYYLRHHTGWRRIDGRFTADDTSGGVLWVANTYQGEPAAGPGFDPPAGFAFAGRADFPWATVYRLVRE